MKLSFPAFVAAAISLTIPAILSAQTVPAGKSAAATNAPAITVTNAAPDAATTNRVAVPPESPYTNTVGMVLLKVGDFLAGKYEVTQAEYQKVMGSNPSSFPGGNRPVDSVSWNDAMDFCAKLTEQDIADKFLPEGYRYTLPTEDQWQSLVADASLADAVTSQGTRRQGTETVGSLGPNSLGLYDTRGNVMEFTLGDTAKPYRVLRGGSWQDFIEINVRLEFRNYCPPDDRKNTYGFRCVLLSPAGGSGQK